MADPADGVLWVANSMAGLVALNLSTLQLDFTVGIPTGGVSQDTLALDPSLNELFVVNETGGQVEAVNASTGHIDATSINAGPGAKTLAYDPADNSLYVAGDNLTIVDPTTRAVVGTPIALPAHTITTGIAFDPSREDLYVTTTGGPLTYSGALTVIDGSSRAAGYGSFVTIPVGELATDPTPLFLPGGASPSDTVVWVPNQQSGTISEITSPPQVTVLAAAPNPIDLGQSVQILLNYTGGVGPDSVTYSGLPSGCLSADRTTIQCTPTATGNFTLVATVTDAFGETASGSTVLRVEAGLSLNLSLSPGPNPALDLGENLTGSATASGGTPSYSYFWSFGDGTTGSGPSARHAYTTTGTYVLSVTVTAAVGGAATDSRVVQVHPPPPVSISVAPFNVTEANRPLKFSADVTGGSGVGVGVWTFGGTVNRTVAPNGSVYATSYAWSQAGVYPATFTYTDTDGRAVRSTESVVVKPTLAATFLVSSSVAGSASEVGTAVDFQATVTGGVSPYNLTWAFGDGSYGFGPSLAHVYSRAGSFSVEVVLVDAAGVRVNSTLPLTVVANASTGAGPTSPTGGVSASLFLGILVGAAVAAVALYAAGRRGHRRPPPHPYVPPLGRK